MANILDLFKRSIHVDVTAANSSKVSKLLGHHLPDYTLPHIQWQNHVNSANHITNMQKPPIGNLMSIGRYPKLRIKR